MNWCDYSSDEEHKEETQEQEAEDDGFEPVRKKKKLPKKETTTNQVLLFSDASAWPHPNFRHAFPSVSKAEQYAKEKRFKWFHCYDISNNLIYENKEVTKASKSYLSSIKSYLPK